MYEKYFYLKEGPFNITPDTRFLFLTRKHREALDLLIYGITSRKGFIMLTAEVGMGKTTICRALLEKLPGNVETALILNPLLSGHELLKVITAEFGLKPAGDTVKDQLDALNVLLLKTAADGGTAAIIIDEAQNLSAEALEMIRLLSNLETEKAKLLQIVLAGQPEFRQKMELPELRQLNQRIIVRYHIDHLDKAETSQYIRARLFIAGGGASMPFTDKVVSGIHEKSAGVPRKINIICDRALTAAYVYDKKICDEESFAKAIEELTKEGYLTAPVRKKWLKFSLFPYIALSTFAVFLLAGILWALEV
ncbi:type II secretory pathway protein ExeA [bacterium]|nr:MAG: type II secretory pathway protein ExeA [bacterium]